MILLLSSCVSIVFDSIPETNDPILLSIYGAQMFKRVVLHDPIVESNVKTDSIKSYFVHHFDITIRSNSNIASCEFQDISVFPEADTIRNCRVAQFIGRLPKSGDIDVTMIRELNKSLDTVNVSYKLENGEIIFPDAYLQ